MQLSKGQNCAVTTDAVTVTCRWVQSPVLDADLSALLLSGGLVRDDSDFVFYNQAVSTDGAVRHDGKRQVGMHVEDRISADLSAIRSDVDTVAIAISLDGTHQTLAALGAIDIAVTDSAASPIATFMIADVTSETAEVTVELYRRGGAWKVRAVGQGYHDGLAGLAQDFGVNVDDASQPTTGVADASTFAPTRIDWSNPPVPAGYEL